MRRPLNETLFQSNCNLRFNLGPKSPASQKSICYAFTVDFVEDHEDQKIFKNAKYLAKRMKKWLFQKLRNEASFSSVKEVGEFAPEVPMTIEKIKSRSSFCVLLQTHQILVMYY